jgi:hypothetical protein
MLTKHLLYLTNQQLTAVLWRNGRALESRAFNHEEAGRREFALYLATRTSFPVYLLADLIEEDFRLDTVPHVGGRDRKALLARKLQQLYRASPFRYAEIQGRESTGRRDDRVLYTAMTNSELLDPLLGVLRTNRAPLVGIYSAPLLSEQLLKDLSVSGRQTLLVTQHEMGGLRQTYFQDGHAKFSRMIPLRDARYSRPRTVADEIRKTWQYLGSLSYFERDEALRVVVVSDHDDETRLRTDLLSGGALEYQFYPMAEAATKSRLKGTPVGSDAVPLLLHVLAEGETKNHFATPELMHYGYLWRAKVLLYAASAMILAGTGLAAAANWFDPDSLAKRIYQSRALTDQINRQTQDVVAAFPASPVAAESLRATVKFYRAAIADAPALEPFMLRLSRVLDAFPGVHLQQIVWSASLDPNAAPRFTPTVRASDTGSVRSTRQVITTPAASTRAAPAQGGEGYYQTAVLEGSVEPFANDYRAALNVVNSMSLALAKLPGARVSPITLPLDTGSDAVLQGTSASTTQPAAANFALQITLAPKQ